MSVTPTDIFYQGVPVGTIGAVLGGEPRDGRIDALYERLEAARSKICQGCFVGPQLHYVRICVEGPYPAELTRVLATIRDAGLTAVVGGPHACTPSLAHDLAIPR